MGQTELIVNNGANVKVVDESKFADEAASNKQRRNMIVGMATVASLVLISTSAMFGIYVPPFVMMALHGENSVTNDAFALTREDVSNFADGAELNVSEKHHSSHYSSDAAKKGGIGGGVGGAVCLGGTIWGLLWCFGCCGCCGCYGCCGSYAQFNTSTFSVSRSCCTVFCLNVLLICLISI